MIRYGSLFFWILLNSGAINSDAQKSDINYRPGLATYKFFNFATGGLAETLTGGSRLFEYGQKPEKQTTDTVYQQNNQQKVNYVNYHQQNNQQRVNYVNNQQQNNRQRTNFPQTINYQPQNIYEQPQNNQPQTAYQQPCANFFSYRIDQNEKFAIVTLPNPDRVRNVLKVQMSLEVRITTVNVKVFVKF
jgi:hypothetical protein